MLRFGLAPWVLLAKLVGFAIAVTLVAAACGGRSVHDRDGGGGDVVASGEGGASQAGAAAGAASVQASEAGAVSVQASEAGAAGATQSMLEQLKGRYLDAICSYYAECQQLRFRDLDDCRAELDPYGVDALLAALAAGHIALDQGLLEKCLDDFAKDPCDPPRVFVTLQNDQLDIYQFLLACPGVLQGLMAEGDPCMADAECGPRLRCEADGCPGVCKPLYELGGPCMTEHEQCGVPYGICLQGTCRVPLEAGGPCADDFDCVRDLLCDSQQHVCVEPAQHPASMARASATSNGGKPAIICQAGLYCDDNDDLGSVGVCRPLSAEGEPCDYQGLRPRPPVYRARRRAAGLSRRKGSRRGAVRRLLGQLPGLSGLHAQR